MYISTLLVIFTLTLGLFICYWFVQSIIDLWYFIKNCNACKDNPDTQVGYHYNHAGAWRSRFYILLFIILLVAWWVLWVSIL